MSYREFFSSINCQCVVIFEDDFKQVACNKARVLYDIARMDINDREQFLSEIRPISEELAKQLSEFLGCFDGVFDAIGNWNEHVVYGDIVTAFSRIAIQSPESKHIIEHLYSAIDEPLIAATYSVGAKYGIGVSRPSQYDSLFTQYLFNENRFKSFRIYTDYSSTSKAQFETDIAKSTDGKSIVCIIDNQLGDVKRAGEIIQTVKENNTPTRKNVVGCVFSSQEFFEEISTDVYFEFIPKTRIDNLEACLAKSAYNYYLSELKRETIGGMTKAFEAAQRNKGIAFFLSRKAKREGESEYQIINDWIHLLSTTQRTNSETIKHLIALSRVINSLEDSPEEYDASLQNLNTLETFDYSINEYYLPVASGDVFTDDGGNWYVLIGQDCDMARRPNKSPRNALAELLPAKPLTQSSFDKWANDLKNASIYNFKRSLDEKSEILQVDYQHRLYISNEILNLCTFNKDGQCRISLSNDLNDSQQRLIPEYWVQYYKSLQEFFKSIKVLRSQAEKEFALINGNEFASRLISFTDFDSNSDVPTFKLRRVCRLSHTYVFYLYKLYLEYRGRQPFQTINLVRWEEITLPVEFTNSPLATDLRIQIQWLPDPSKSNRKKWCWIIEKKEVVRILDKLGIEIPSDLSDELILIDETFDVILADGKKLQIQKAKESIKLVVT